MRRCKRTIDKAIVHPEAHKVAAVRHVVSVLLPRCSLRLGNLILVVGENQIPAARKLLEDRQPVSPVASKFADMVRYNSGAQHWSIKFHVQLRHLTCMLHGAQSKGCQHCHGAMQLP